MLLSFDSKDGQFIAYYDNFLVEGIKPSSFLIKISMLQQFSERWKHSAPFQLGPYPGISYVLALQ